MRGCSATAALLTGFLALAACGGSESVAIDEWPDALVHAFCSHLARCDAYVSMDACLAFNADFDISRTLDAIAAGRIAYDEEDAGACADALAGASCDSTSTTVRYNPEACERAFRGAVADGGRCYRDAECVSGRCDIPDCGQACCVGPCLPTIADAAIGASCATADCVRGAFCDANDVCTALLARGAACSFAFQCGSGLTCAGDVCVTAAHRGDPCLDGFYDDVGDRCDGSKCVVRSGIGGPCTARFGGVYDCQFPLVCSPGLTCVEPPTAGQPCVGNACGASQFCNDHDVCEAPRVNGAPCVLHADCASSYCDATGANWVCAPEQVCGG